MVLRVFIISLMASSCGAEVDIPDLFIHPQLEPYVDGFRLDAERYTGGWSGLGPVRIIDIVDSFTNDELSKGAVGVCSRKSNSSKARWREIEILRSTFDRYTEQSPHKAKILVYHELGHCVLGRGHAQSPKQIMSAMIPIYRESKLVRWWPEMVERLFRSSSSIEAEALVDSSDSSDSSDYSDSSDVCGLRQAASR